MAAPKAPFYGLFKPLIVHARPCAAVRSRPSAGGERQRRSRDSIFPGWNLVRTAPRTGSSVCFLPYEAALFPTRCPVAGQRPGNICRPATGKCSERRRRAPSRYPAIDSSHHHCCNIDAPTLEHAGTGDNRNGVSVFPINHPLPIWIERGGLLSMQTAPQLRHFPYSVALISDAVSPYTAGCTRPSLPVSSEAAPVPPILPASVPE